MSDKCALCGISMESHERRVCEMKDESTYRLELNVPALTGTALTWIAEQVEVAQMAHPGKWIELRVKGIAPKPNPHVADSSMLTGEVKDFVHEPPTIASIIGLPAEEKIYLFDPGKFVRFVDPKTGGDVIALKDAAFDGRQNVHTFTDGDGSWPVMEAIDGQPKVVEITYNDVWTCTNHSPGLEVKDIPVGEKCGACGRGE